MTVRIRTENERDYDQVYQVNCTAFGNREDEAKLVERIRSTSYWVPELSLIAEQDDEIVGHLLLSKAAVVDGETQHEVIVLAPIAVKPEYQKHGIGKQLIREGLERCRQLGYYIVLLIGHPSYYPQFGFQPARSYGLELKQFEVPDDVFMVCELKENELLHLRGELKYPAAFFG
ncbi:N-acetyltransferase [Paenibacillus sp. CCS19]|uniref:GNAT family N-acetyltransferase n=1 Tax=Paenibacillus sp. CCS19 TaxID=3158387 RepID=UPI002562659B|nr:N-acetyltransferase [Paenibacillus cellulosilyticus]GMK41290.1 N-acetyltransferase [Paenibacillus cellulosilyticus]